MEISTSRLKELDALRSGSIGEVPLWLHNHHRWTLPLIAAAQDIGHVPRPCHLLVFDQHRDALAPRCVAALQELREKGVTIDALIDLSARHLSTMNDDWIKGSMELGLVDHAIVFGAGRAGLPDNELEFNDRQGERHRIFLPGLPRAGLDYQGDLSDLARHSELRELWNLLGWDSRATGEFSFAEKRTKLFLSIDLDCFIMRWREYLLPWVHEVYEKEFHTASTYGPTEGRTGKDFFDGLLASAGVIDIAREPDCCGGSEKADQVLADLNRYIFDGRLAIS